ncbi:MAG: hypothetical protein JWR77_1356, partial [Rhizorhabdus sp.]|nr:hypothetical protein [Rhizorhabdus sp.]
MAALEARLKALADEFNQLNAIYQMADDFDPYPIYARMRAEEPVLRGDFLGRYGLPSQANYLGKRTDVVTLFRHADIMRVLADTASFSSDLNNDGFGAFWGEKMPLSVDGDTHRRLRALVNPTFFGPALLQEWRRDFIDPAIRDEYIVPLALKGRCELVQDFTLPYPVRVMYEILGFPNDPETVMQFAKWTFRVFAGLAPNASQAVLDDAADCATKLYDNLLDVVRKRRAEGAEGNDLISRLIRAEGEEGRLGDREIASLVRSLLP